MMWFVERGWSRVSSFHERSYDDILKILRMFIGKGGDIAEALDDVVSVITNANRWYRSDIPGPDMFESLTLFIDFLASERVEDAWRWLLQIFGHSMFRPSEQSQNFLRSAIRIGLGPNRHTEVRIIHEIAHEKSIHDTYGTPILTQAICAMGEAKEREISKEANGIAEEVSQENDVEVNRDGTETLPLWCIVSTLIEAGADIYYTDSEDFDGPSSWLSIWTPWDRASQYDVLNEWEAALRECGLDPTEVLREDVQRCKQALRLHGATRTGVDEEMLALPSAAGLRCRICRSKYCTKHGTKTFFYGY
jgi:hypothetical protein